MSSHPAVVWHLLLVSEIYKLSVFFLLLNIDAKVLALHFINSPKPLHWHLEILCGIQMLHWILCFKLASWSLSVYFISLCLNGGRVRHYTRLSSMLTIFWKSIPVFASVNHDCKVEF